MLRKRHNTMSLGAVKHPLDWELLWEQYPAAKPFVSFTRTSFPSPNSPFPNLTGDSLGVANISCASLGWGQLLKPWLTLYQEVSLVHCSQRHVARIIGGVG